MYGTSTGLAQVNATITDIGLFLVLVVGAIMGAWASLTGLGYFKRKVQHYIAGRKF